MKKFIRICFYLIIANFSIFIANSAWPEVKCSWLPWCDSGWWNDIVVKSASILVSEMIKYTSVLAVIAFMMSWIFYVISNWVEEKAKKAKNWMIWSWVWVLVSVSAWFIINIINNINLNI